jgi:hypothetical protein
MLRKLGTRIGHRGAYLLFLALLDGVYVYALAFLPVLTFHTFVSPYVWAGAWGLTGLACLIQSFMSWDRIAFTMAAGVKFTWGIEMLSLPHYGWLSASVWWSFGLITAIIASWQENVPLIDPGLPSLNINVDG